MHRSLLSRPGVVARGVMTCLCAALILLLAPLSLVVGNQPATQQPPGSLNQNMRNAPAKPTSNLLADKGFSQLHRHDALDGLVIEAHPAVHAERGAVGSVRVVDAETGAVWLHLRSERLNDYFGYATTWLGDVNGDGWPDLAIGIPNAADPQRLERRGVVRIVSGLDGSTLREIEGAPGEVFGVNLAAIEDQQDELPLLAVQWRRQNADGTVAYGGDLYDVLSGERVDGVIDAHTLATGRTGIAWRYHEDRLHAGLAGDFNGDGLVDLADFQILIDALGTEIEVGAEHAMADDPMLALGLIGDLNQDGVVDEADLQLFAGVLEGMGEDGEFNARSSPVPPPCFWPCGDLEPFPGGGPGDGPGTGEPGGGDGGAGPGSGDSGTGSGGTWWGGGDPCDPESSNYDPCKEDCANFDPSKCGCACEDIQILSPRYLGAGETIFEDSPPPYVEWEDTNDEFNCRPSDWEWELVGGAHLLQGNPAIVIGDDEGTLEYEVRFTLNGGDVECTRTHTVNVVHYNGLDFRYTAFISCEAVENPVPLGPEFFGGDARTFSGNSQAYRAAHQAESVSPNDYPLSNDFTDIPLTQPAFGLTTGYNSSAIQLIAGYCHVLVTGQPSATATAQVICGNVLGNHCTKAMRPARNRLNIVLYLSGANPLVLGSCEIRSRIAFEAIWNINAKTGTQSVEIKTVAWHVRFPSHEFYIKDETIFQHDPASLANPGDTISDYLFLLCDPGVANVNDTRTIEL